MVGHQMNAQMNDALLAVMRAAVMALAAGAAYIQKLNSMKACPWTGSHTHTHSVLHAYIVRCDMDK